MKTLLILTIICLMFGTAFTPLNPPIRYPASLDELYQFIENSEPGWVFSDCTNLTKPYVTWGMAKEVYSASVDDNGRQTLVIAAADLSRIIAPGGITFPGSGTLTISESQLFALLVFTVLSGDVLACGIEGKPVMYGVGVKTMFERIEKEIMR